MYFKQGFLYFLFAVLFCSKCLAQDSSAEKINVAFVAPLYLDSAFDHAIYKLQPNNIPQYILTGLDFYNGGMMAVDSMQKESINASFFVYDLKASNSDSVFNDMKANNISLIIGSFNNVAEQKLFSTFSFTNNIPLVSATYPNDAGISGNPFFILLNSTLQTHIAAIHAYLQKYFSKSKIIFITRNGFLENKINTFFEADNKTDKPLQYKLASLSDNFASTDLLPLLDSTKQNIIVCGSMNEAFASNVFQTIASAGFYRAYIIGMPNWDGIKELNKPLVNTNISIVYSTPFNLAMPDSALENVSNIYREKFVAKPSDMVYKGFEATYHFTHLFSIHAHDFMNHLSDKDFSVFDEYNIIPVKTKSTSFIPDYLENKKIYFVKKINGKVVSTLSL